MSIYHNSCELFTDLIKYNEQNIEYLGGLQIPMTNIYYITVLDPKDTNSINFMSHVANSENPNPFDNIKLNINIDNEQIYNINLITNSINLIDNTLTEVFENVSKSNSQISIVLDIGFIFNLISSFEKEEIEIHLYDFLLYKLKKKINKLFILDTDNILKFNATYSSVYDELKIQLLIKNDSETINIPDTDITIYKYYDSLYWRILDLNQHIEKLDENEVLDNISIYEIDDKEAFLKTTNISKICFTNLFEMHSVVLHPLDKLKILTF